MLSNLNMLGFPPLLSPPKKNNSISDVHEDPCSHLSILLLTAAMVMPVIDEFLESSATQQFHNSVINNSVNCSSPHPDLTF